MIDPGQQTLCLSMRNLVLGSLAEAADAPRHAAAAAAATTTATATATTATTAAATAAATATAPGHLLHAALAVLLVEEVEGRKAHIGDLFFAEDEALIGNRVEGFRDISRRQRGGRCAPRQ